MPFPCPDCHTINRDRSFYCEACGCPFRQAPLSERLNLSGPPPPMAYSPSPQAMIQAVPPYHAPLASYDPPSLPSAPPQPDPMANPSGFMAMCQTLGLHPLTTVVLFAVDWMMFGGEVMTVGIGWTVSILVSFVLGFGVFLTQKHIYKDDHETALAKAVMLALLTAIPTPLPGFLTAPSGFLGLIKVIKGNNDKK